MSSLKSSMAKAGSASKDLAHGESACPHAQIHVQIHVQITMEAGDPARSPRASGAPDSDAANPIPVCSHGKS
jgi:hypothetical protein